MSEKNIEHTDEIMKQWINQRMWDKWKIKPMNNPKWMIDTNGKIWNVGLMTSWQWHHLTESASYGLISVNKSHHVCDAIIKGHATLN